MSGTRQSTGGPTAHRADRAYKRMVAGYLEAEEFDAVKSALAKHRLWVDVAVQQGVALVLKERGEWVRRSMKQRLKALGL